MASVEFNVVLALSSGLVGSLLTFLFSVALKWYDARKARRRLCHSFIVRTADACAVTLCIKFITHEIKRRWPARVRVFYDFCEEHKLSHEDAAVVFLYVVMNKAISESGFIDDWCYSLRVFDSRDSTNLEGCDELFYLLPESVQFHYLSVRELDKECTRYFKQLLLMIEEEKYDSLNSEWLRRGYRLIKKADDRVTLFHSALCSCGGVSKRDAARPVRMLAQRYYEELTRNIGKEDTLDKAIEEITLEKVEAYIENYKAKRAA